MVDLASSPGQAGVDPESTRSSPRADLGPIQGRSNVDPGSVWGRSCFARGSMLGRSGVNLGDRSGIDVGGIRRRLQGQSGADFGVDLVSTQNPLLKPFLSSITGNSKRLGPESQLALPLAIVISCSGSLGGPSGGGTIGAPAQRRDWPATRGFAGLGWFASSAGDRLEKK